jgi:hypothetical protein
VEDPLPVPAGILVGGVAVDDEDVKIDLEYFRRLQDMAIGNFLLGFAPDEDSRKTLIRLLACCNKHGVSSMQVMNIFRDFSQEMDLDQETDPQ